MTTESLASAIEVRGLEKSFKDLHVLRGVDLQVARGSWAVMPVDSPTVAKAETTSYSTSSRLNGVVIANSTAGMTTAAMPRRAAAPPAPPAASR